MKASTFLSSMVIEKMRLYLFLFWALFPTFVEVIKVHKVSKIFKFVSEILLLLNLKWQDVSNNKLLIFTTPHNTMREFIHILLLPNPRDHEILSISPHIRFYVIIFIH